MIIVVDIITVGGALAIIYVCFFLLVQLPLLLSLYISNKKT